MTTRTRKIALAIALSTLGVAAALAAARPTSEAASPPATAAPRESALAHLDLTKAQLQEIEQLRAREERRIAALERALAEAEQELRRVELAKPFDPTRVSALVAQRAEIAAYLRGTESRLVSEIAGLLTAQQRARFAELREAGALATSLGAAASEAPLTESI